MGTEVSRQGKNSIGVVDKRRDIEYINKTFGIGKTVTKLHEMMDDITKDEISAKNINAACNCISQLNQTINTTIEAARYLAD